MHTTRFALVVFFASLAFAPLTAQGVVRDIPSNTPSTGACGNLPFGDGGAATTNVRMQWLVTRAELGSTAGWITGISFAPCAGGLHQFDDSVEVWLATMPLGFSFTGHTVFDDNRWSQSTLSGLVVFQEFNPRWTKTANAWSTMGADTSYWYDGQGDLLVEVNAVGNRSSNGSSTVHHDSRPCLVAAGWSGTWPPSGVISSGAPKVRLQFSVADKSTFNVGCHGFGLALGGNPVPGATLAFQTTGGGAGLPAVLNLGLNSPNIELGVIYIPGCWLLSDLSIASIQGATNGSGAWTMNLTLPTSSSLNGARVVAQSVHLNPALPQLVATSNGVRFVIGPAQP